MKTFTKESIFDVVNYYRRQSGQPPLTKNTQQISCLFPERHEHEDQSRSARIYREGGNVYCFACATSWDAIGLVREMETLSYVKAREFLANHFDFDMGVFDESHPDEELLKVYERVIIEHVIALKPSNFQKIYAIVDNSVQKKDLKTLKKLLEKLQSVRKAKL